MLAQDQAVRVTTDALSVHAGPDSAYGVIGTVHRDQVSIATEESAGYLKVWYNRSEGWVHGDHVELRSTSYDDVFRGTNVRSGPGSSHAKVGYAKRGSKWALISTSTSGNWHMVFYEGKQCWFYAKGRATTLEYVAPVEPQSVSVDEAVRVVVAASTVRTGPGAGYDPLGTASLDQVYFSTEVFDGWRKVWFSRSEGWVPDDDMTLESAEYDVVDWDWLNVRSGPGLEHEKIDSVPAGSKWVTLDYSGSWHQIHFAGTTHWLSGVGVTTMDYVAPDGASPSPTTSPVNFVKLPASGPGFVRRCGANNPDHAWGTAELVSGLVSAAEQWEADHPDYPRIRIGDISLPEGGPFVDNGTNHISHQNGTEVDIFLVRNDSSEDSTPDIFSPEYSSERTRSWITDYLRVQFPQIEDHGILFNDPNIFGALTTVSAVAVCPGEGCPVDEAGANLLPSIDGLSYVRCNPRHECHMHVRIAAP